MAKTPTPAAVAAPLSYAVAVAGVFPDPRGSLVVFHGTGSENLMLQVVMPPEEEFTKGEKFNLSLAPVKAGA
jgi:hypothetical protein